MFTSTCTFGMFKEEWAGVMGNLWGTCMGYGESGLGLLGTCMGYGRKKKGQACACPYKGAGYHFFQ